MAQGKDKVGQILKVTYQAVGATTGLADVTMEIYDETGSKDVVNFPDVSMTELGSSGRYEGSFTPDAEGKWRVMIDSATKPGKVVRDYDIVAHNIDSIGDEMAKDSTVAKAGADGDTLKDISDQIDNIDTSAPPMIG
jgi:hypothetical protein